MDKPVPPQLSAASNPMPEAHLDTAAEDYREAVLRQVRALTEDNQRLFQAALRSEKRFRMLAKAVWKIQEDERRRLARELHDGIGQTLTALANHLQRIADDAHAHENVGLAGRLGDALDITRSALHDTRELSRLLRPTLLDDLGLEVALQWLTRTLAERCAISIECSSTLGEQRLTQDLETLVFRVTQEALTNVIRHSNASEAQVRLTRIGNLLRLQVSDDGRGFDPGELNNPDKLGDSVGVRGMRDRAELFGGRLELKSAPGEGTRVTLVVPVEAGDEIPAVAIPATKAGGL
ncbi:MAG: Histidine kinase, gyrase and HSP90-like ATPase [Hydrocarboniphaga sp.]|uniref:sensor histidine kinase n=1 Tax=Hydrocarboniphaga sp. TaxID=2033016 RepID=UPI00263A1B32|nr:sensor histidine kinase [Hydrocarboniphaga sp.]MDB5971556.1 Histidine kinase, gyrase and HSP90-like ATPase [Hydrocarboniphaga sp.]